MCIYFLLSPHGFAEEASIILLAAWDLPLQCLWLLKQAKANDHSSRFPSIGFFYSSHENHENQRNGNCCDWWENLSSCWILRLFTLMKKSNAQATVIPFASELNGLHTCQMARVMSLFQALSNIPNEYFLGVTIVLSSCCVFTKICWGFPCILKHSHLHIQKQPLTPKQWLKNMIIWILLSTLSAVVEHPRECVDEHSTLPSVAHHVCVD